MDEQTKYTLATGHSVIFTHQFRIYLSKKDYGTLFFERECFIFFYFKFDASLCTLHLGSAPCTIITTMAGRWSGGQHRCKWRCYGLLRPQRCDYANCAGKVWSWPSIKQLNRERINYSVTQHVCVCVPVLWMWWTFLICHIAGTFFLRSSKLSSIYENISVSWINKNTSATGVLRTSCAPLLGAYKVPVMIDR